jgi:NAD-dependent DNA ligase
MSSITKTLIAKLEKEPHQEGLKLDIKLLEKILKKAINDYYNTDKPLLTDKTFDILETILKERYPEAELFKTIGAPITNNEDKVKLPYYLGSLDKVKPGEKILTKWLKDNEGSVLISEKLDGLSCLLVIEKSAGGSGSSSGGGGNLNMKLYKHGDGYEGQEITNLLENVNINKTKLNMKEIEKLLSIHKHIAIRGEIIIKNNVFDTKYTKLYPKARSLIAGIVNSKKPDSKIVKDIDIVFYEWIAPDTLTYENQFNSLKKIGVLCANYKIYPSLTETQIPELLMDFKKESLYEIDGIILSNNTKSHKRVTSGNPKYSVAYKMVLDDQIATTTVINVEYNISKHGALAPRIQYKPITIKGDNHQYTSGFNMKYIVDNNIGPGTEIQIIKSGDVIPYIYKIIKCSASAQMPDSTIKWHWNETRVDAIVDDMETNSDVRVKRIISFFSVMKIAGVGEGVVNKLVNAGYEEIRNILDLTPDVMARIDGFQLKSATNVYNSIHKVIDVEQPLERVMMASNIFGLGLGEKKFKLIVDAIPNFMVKWKKGLVLKDDIMNIDGFSDKSTEVFFKGMPKFIEWLKLYSMIKLDLGSDTKIDVGDKFTGMVVVFTGVRNADMEKIITDGGGVIGSGITGKTTMVVAKDITENSGKIKTAREKGIQLMNIDDFAKFIGFKL